MSTTTLLTVRVAHKRLEAEDIASFELVPTDGQALPPFAPGAHIDVHLPAQAGRPALVRQYSLCNSAGETHRYRIAVLRDAASRGGSIGMHDAVQEGDTLTISAPRNHFALQAAEHTLLLAGGIGVTPLLCMAEQLARTGASFALHYCSRSAGRTAFRQEIAASPMAPQVHFHFDDGPPGQAMDWPSVLAAPTGDQRLYVCGPAGFIDHVVATARAQGWPPERIHLEYFGAPAQDTAGDAGFEVRLARSGKTYRIAPDTTIVQALRQEGVDIMTACEQGVCGTCVTRVLEGAIDHRDMYLTDEEKQAGDQCLPCCSRAKGPLLVLDL